jgi:hypothetical protein
MAQEQIIWTAIPSGTVQRGAERRLRLALVPAPRLSPGAGEPSTLALFSFLEWPARLQPGRVSYEVLVGGQHTGDAEAVGPAPDLALWRALFDATTPVVGYERPRPETNVVNTYNVEPIVGTVRSGYGQLGTTVPHGQPEPTQVRDAFRDLHESLSPLASGPTTPAGTDALLALTHAAGPLESATPLDAYRVALAEGFLRHDRLSTRDERVAALSQAAQQTADAHGPDAVVELVPDTGRPAAQFARFLAFHVPEASDVGGFRATDQPPAHNIPDGQARADFHHALTALAEYPALLRRLGLVIDLECAVDVVPPSSSDQPLGLQVRPVFAPAVDPAPPPDPAAQDLTITRYVFQPAGGPLGQPVFEPAPLQPQRPEVAHGLLNLLQPPPTDPNGEQYSLVQLDVESAAFKTLQLVEGAAQASDGAPAGGVPALRTAGLSLVRRDHAQSLMTAVKRVDTHNDTVSGTALAGREGTAPPVAPRPAEVFADDLVRGYRIDVRDSQTRTWRSLHQRIGTYAVDGAPLMPCPLADEGYIQVAQLEPTMSGQAPRVHEYLAHWQGWSLSVPRLGKSVEATPRTADTAAAPASLLRLRTTFTVAPGSLPRLRFTRGYQLRARIVNLAGDSLSLDEADALIAALELTGSAPVVPQQLDAAPFQRFEPVGPPELVLREALTEGESLTRLVIRSNLGVSAEAWAAPLGDPRYQGVSERHVAPPKVAQHMAETHGLFDALFAEGQHARGYRLASKEKGSFAHREILDVETGQLRQIEDVTVTHPATDATMTRPAVELVPTGFTVGILVTGPGGVSPTQEAARYTYDPPPYLILPPPAAPVAAPAGAPTGGPVVTGLDPTHGPVAGGTTVLISGRGFTGATAVTFGTAPAEYTVVSDTLIQAVSPPNPLGYAVHHEAQLELPYLPDPLAVGVALWGLPQVPYGKIGRLDQSGQLSYDQNTDLPPSTLQALGGDLTQFDFGPEWPDRRPFRLQLAEGNDPPTVVTERVQVGQTQVEARVLRVCLPQARSATIRLSCYPTEAGLEVLAIQHWITDWTNDPANSATSDQKEALTAAASGGLALLSPQREITLLHAVQQPLVVPDLGQLTVHNRPQGATYTHLDGTIPLDGLSTGRLDLEAAWDEWVDDPGTPPHRQHHTAHIFDVLVHAEGDPVPTPPAPMPAATFDAAAGLLRLHAPLPGGDPSGRTYLSRHEFGDTRCRYVTYHAVATSRFREYFPSALTRDPKNVTQLATIERTVPSAAPPPVPHVRFVVPAMRWLRSTDEIGPLRRNVRRGNGLRVYLARPWFVSGDDEQLAVVIAGGPTVTTWGNDPIFAPSPALAATRDPDRVTVLSGDPAQTEGGLRFVPHAVWFDAAIDLWCCDIELSLVDPQLVNPHATPDAPGQPYFPFVRLALARFQRNAVHGCRLSPLVVTEGVQVLPNRVVTLIPSPTDPDCLDISLSGPAHAGVVAQPGAPALRSVVEVTLEQRESGGTAGDLDWTPVPPLAAPAPPHVVPATGSLQPPELWRGTVHLPTPRARGQYRVSLCEFEQLPSSVNALTTSGVLKRLIFAETISVPAR